MQAGVWSAALGKHSADIGVSAWRRKAASQKSPTMIFSREYNFCKTTVTLLLCACGSEEKCGNVNCRALTYSMFFNLLFGGRGKEKF